MIYDVLYTTNNHLSNAVMHIQIDANTEIEAAGLVTHYVLGYFYIISVTRHNNELDYCYALKY